MKSRFTTSNQDSGCDQSRCCRSNTGLTGLTFKRIFLMTGIFFLFMAGNHRAVAQATGSSTIQGNFQVDGDLYTRLFQFPALSPPCSKPADTLISDDWFPRAGSPPPMVCHSCGPNGSPVANYGIGVIDTTGAYLFMTTQTNCSGNEFNITHLFKKSFDSLSVYIVPSGPEAGDTVVLIDAFAYRDNWGLGGGSKQDSTVFTGSAKNGMNPKLWPLGLGTSGPNKNDLIDVMDQLRFNINAGKYIPIYGTPIRFTASAAGTTLSTSGDSHFDLEIFKTATTYSTACGCLVNTGPDSGHTAYRFILNATQDTLKFDQGDIINTADYTNGGTEAEVNVRIWVNPRQLSLAIGGSYPASGASASDWNTLAAFYNAKVLSNAFKAPFLFTDSFDNTTTTAPFGYAQIKPISVSTTFAWARINAHLNACETQPTTITAAPYGSLVGSGAACDPLIEERQFFEGAIDNSRLGISFFGGQFSPDNPCQQNFGSIMFKTRSSASFTASLKDFAGPFPYVSIKQVAVAAPPVTTLTCSAPSATICAQVTSASPATYEWRGPGVDCASAQTAPVVGTSTCITVSLTGANRPGYYVFTANLTQGCFADTCILVQTDTDPPSLTCGGTNIACNGNANGSACVTATGTSTPFTYSWSNGATTNCISNLGAGTYTVSVTGANGCSSSCSYTVSEPPALNSSCGPKTNVSCNGGTDGSVSVIASGGTPPYSFSWNNGGNSSAINNLVAGTYCVTVTDARGCRNTGTCCTITEPPALIPSCSVTSNISCNGACDGTATSGATGGTSPYSFAWSNGQNSANASGLCAQTYTVTITDAHGCKTTCSVTPTQPPALNSSCGPQRDVTCFGGSDGSVSVIASGGTAPYSYLWSNGRTTTANSGIVAGTYCVTVTDAHGCRNTGTCCTINQPPALVPSCSVTNDASCSGVCNGSATSGATGGTAPYSFLWSNGQTNANATGLCATTYTVTITDSHGCTATCSVTPTTPASVNTSCGPKRNITCNGGSDGSVSVIASGGTPPYTILWSNGGNTSAINNLVAGTYCVTVTDMNNCSNTGTCCTITQPPALVPSCSVTRNVSCNSACDATATSGATGGTTPYSFLWSNGQTNANATNLCATTYTVTITDAHGCVTTCSVTPTEPPALNTSCGPQRDVTCNGANDGSVSVIASGGSAPYSYAWSNGGNTSAISNLGGGTYCVTVTDANGCRNTGTCCTITEPPAIVPSCSVTRNVSCNNACDATATSGATGGTSPYSFLWSNGQTNANATNLCATTYTVTITDARGCTTTCSVTPTEPPALNSSCGPLTNVNCNGGTDGSVSVVASGGAAPYSYLWSNGANSSSNSGIGAGTYCVTITDANGCVNTGTCCTVTQPPALNVSCTGTPNQDCTNIGSAAATVSGGTTPYSYAWSNGGNTSSISGLTSGTYCVTVTDANNCITSCCYTVTQPGCGGHIFPTNTSCSEFSSGTATAFHNVCVNRNAGKVTNATPGVFFYYTKITAPSSSFCVEVVQTRACSQYAYFDLQKDQLFVFTSDSCDRVGTTTVTEVSGSGVAKVCITGATTGAVYVISAKYSVKSIVGTNSNGNCMYHFISKLNGTPDPTSEDSLLLNTNLSCVAYRPINPDPIVATDDAMTMTVYPNPFSTQTTIEFTLHQPSSRTIVEVFDLTGTKVATLFNGNVETEVPTKVTFDGYRYSEGIYLYKVTTDEGSLVNKVMLMK